MYMRQGGIYWEGNKDVKYLLSVSQPPDQKSCFASSVILEFVY